MVFDKMVEDIPKTTSMGSRRQPQNSGLGVFENHPVFEIDKCIDHKLLISVVPDGYLKRV